MRFLVVVAVAVAWCGTSLAAIMLMLEHGDTEWGVGVYAAVFMSGLAALMWASCEGDSS